MIRSLAIVAGAASLAAGLVAFGGALTAMANAPKTIGWYQTKAECQTAGGEYVQDNGPNWDYECVDDTSHNPPWALDVFYVLPPP